MVQTNGVHGDQTNGQQPQKDIPVTKLLASFTATTTTRALAPALREKVKEVLIDYIGCVVGALQHADSTEPIYTAVTALQGGPISSPKACTVLGKGAPHFLPQYAGLLNAALGHSLDFDDTYAEGTLHAGVTAISAALTQAEILGSDSSSEDFMLAIAVGYEVTCRIGRELGFDAYSRGFHNTSTAGIFGSVAAIAVLKKLAPETVEMAFGLAGSKAAGSMQYLDNGSWNKRLHPGFAVHDAFVCVALAEAGVVGATRILEGKSGFLKAYTPREEVDLARLVGGLGEEWCWLRSSLKPYAACRMTHGFIELCGTLRASRVEGADTGRLAPSDVKAITLTMSPSNFILVGDPTPNKRHPTNTIDAQFSAYFQVGHALIHGAKTGDMAPYSRLTDLDISNLSDKIAVETDDRMTGFSARTKVEWADGEVEAVQQQFPLGEVEHPFTREKVDEKFLVLAGPVYGVERAGRVIGMVDAIERYGVRDLLGVLR